MKYAVIPNKDQNTVGPNYTVELPDNKVINVEARFQQSYLDASGQEHTKIDIVTAKLAEKSPWTQTETDEINALWDAIGKPDRFIRISTKKELAGVRYDSIEEVELDENRQYEIWKEIPTRNITFINLNQVNTDFAIDTMDSSRGKAVGGFKYIGFNTKPSAPQIAILEDLADKKDLASYYFDPVLADRVVIV